MKTFRSILRPVLLAGLFLCAGMAVQAQIYEPDGLRMPGTWNDWANTTGMGGPFDLQKVQTGTPRWQTTFHHAGPSGIQEFKFVSTGFGDPWKNQWAGNPNGGINLFTPLTYGAPSEPNNKVTLAQDKWYTVIFQDLGYINTRALFMETTAEPVEISSVEQNPLLVGSADPVAVTATLSGTPSPEEVFFLCYSTDGWATASLMPMSAGTTTATGTIPAQPDDTTVSYYIFSSTIQAPVSDWDLVTLRLNNNGGDYYTYTVGQSVTCGQASGLLTTEPPFPQESLPVTLYFNAEYGNGGLFNYEGDVYAHTGVITNLSTSGTDWKYVKTEWGQNTPETKLTRLGANLYSLSISDIRQYYGVPSAEQILKLAFVFRGGEPVSGTQYAEHKNADGSDIYAEVYLPALRVKIMTPTARDPLASPNQVMPVCVEALQNQEISLYLGDQPLTTVSASSLAYPLVLQGMAPGSYWVKAVATGNTGQARDSVNIYLRGPVAVAPLPTGVHGGINYIDETTVTLVLEDPAGKKSFAFAIGEFSNWLPNDAGYMKRTPDGKAYWVTLSGLTKKKEYAYQYYVDGKLKLADPYADKVLDPWSDKWIPKSNYPDLKAYPFDKTVGVVSLFQTSQVSYPWEVTSFVPPAVDGTQSDLLVYELLLRDFTDSSGILTAMEKLPYLKNLGVNAVQLMPVMEFDGNESWGYAPNFFFAPDKFYGRKTDYKRFIDECHKLNMAVVLDIVTNHCFGLCPLAMMYFDPLTGTGQPLPENPWLNPQAPHPLSVGYDFNHQSPHTRAFFKRVLEYWLTEYKVDGFRFDLSKGLTQKYSGSDLGAWSQYDQGRIDILNDYYQHIKSVNPKAYVILEHFAENSEETVLANAGMLPWSGMHDRYKQVGIGWSTNSDLSWAYHANRGWTYPNLIDYMENHDQDRIMFEALSYGNASGVYNIKDTATALHHQQMTAAMFLGIPGPKMVWQFGELGYDYSILFGGERTSPKPPRWDYYSEPARRDLYHVYSGMAALRKCDAFRYGTFTSDLAGAGKRMWIAHASMNVVIAGNMDVTGFDMAPGFQHTGQWYDYFSGETVNISDPAGHTFNFPPGSFRVFTDVRLPKPWHQVRVTVLDSLSGLPVAGAEVILGGATIARSDAQGLALFPSAPGQQVIGVVKPGYKNWATARLVSDSLSLTARLQRGPTGTDDPAVPDPVKIYPNPAVTSVTISAPVSDLVEVITPAGKLVARQKMSSHAINLDISAWTPGVYIIRITGSHAGYTRKLVIAGRP